MRILHFLLFVSQEVFLVLGFFKGTLHPISSHTNTPPTPLRQKLIEVLLVVILALNLFPRTELGTCFLSCSRRSSNGVVVCCRHRLICPLVTGEIFVVSLCFNTD